MSLTLLMKKSTLHSSFLTLVLLFTFSSCKILQKKPSEGRTNLDYKSAPVLTNFLKKNELDFQWLNAKFNCETVIDSNRNSFNMTMRIRKDSMMWFSISPALGIEVARAVITKDSVKFINRLNSTFFSGDFNYVSKLLHSDLDYEMVQSLLIGNSVDFYEDDERLKSSIDKGQYLLSTIRKRKLRKVITKNKELKDPVQSIWLDPKTFKITRILFHDFNTNREFDANFREQQFLDSVYFPRSVNYMIRAEKNVSIDVNYSKVSINKPQTFPFNIPEKYEPIVYKER